MMVLTLVAHAEEITSVKVGLKVFFILDPDRRALSFSGRGKCHL